MRLNPFKVEAKAEDQPQQAPTFLQMVKSVLASFFGVQNARNRKRDFTYGKAKAFILVGILMTAVWYGTIFLIVKVVLKLH